MIDYRKENANIELIAVTLICFSIFVLTDISILSFLLIIFSLALLFYARHSLMIFLSSLIIAYSNYSIVVYRYGGKDLMEDWNSFNHSPDIDLTALRIVVFFTFVLALRTRGIYNKMRKGRNNIERIIEEKPSSNIFLVVITCIALVIIWFFFYDFSFGTQAGYHPLYEYSTVFFIMGLKYAGNKWKLYVPILALALFYMVFDFLGGQRSTGVQIALIVLLMRFYRYLSPKRVVTLAFVGIFITTAVGALRGSLFMPNFTMKDVFDSMSNSMFASATAGYAYYTSLTFIATMDIYSFWARMGQFGDFVTSIFVSGADEGLAWITLKHYEHMFGGILGVYLYYYLGYLGTFLIATLVGCYYKLMSKFNLSRKYRTSLSFVVCIYVTATTTRWYLYTPSQLLRGVLLLSLVYYGYKVIDKFKLKRL